MKKTIVAGVLVGASLFARSALACELRTDTPYAVSVHGTGSVGVEGLGHLEFENDGTMHGDFAVHFPNRKACVSHWQGTYTRSGTTLSGYSYDTNVMVTGPCLPRAGVAVDIIVEPRANGDRLIYGTMRPTGDNLNGDGEVQ